MRPKHWVKNLFLFVPYFFSGSFFNLKGLFFLFIGSLAFSFMASSIYIVNDWFDINFDKMHPVKCNRPLASGLISKKIAAIIICSLIVLSHTLGCILTIRFLIVLDIYFIVNLFYSIGLKNISVLDIFILATGFVLRLIAGGVIAAVALSEWIIVMVFLLALFLAIAKRRDEVLISLTLGKEIRKANKGYNLDFLNVLLALVASAIVISYLIYTLSPDTILRMGSHKLYYTFVFVLSGLFRYLQLTYVYHDTGSPVKVFYTDRFIQISVVLWILTFFTIIYCKDFLDYMIGP
ncbi:UbiA prenyltransferase family protein [Chitinophaga sancti]|uniref:UbiA prenyltransferase family protein n=1 Tax=Chitinophaga sancti TaxID=1004 RepID=UPI001FED0B37|nr:UbiA prenyltransferase family protein [Chitinophaga sancti]